MIWAYIKVSEVLTKTSCVLEGYQKNTTVLKMISYNYLTKFMEQSSSEQVDSPSGRRETPCLSCSPKVSSSA
jgi:hypothetical protein